MQGRQHSHSKGARGTSRPYTWPDKQDWLDADAGGIIEGCLFIEARCRAEIAGNHIKGIGGSSRRQEVRALQHQREETPGLRHQYPSKHPSDSQRIRRRRPIIGRRPLTRSTGSCQICRAG
eukprot:4267196-Pyramimonas_sp.AAC.1